MLRTLDCEAVLLGCRTVDLDGAAAGECVAAPGADHLLGRLPAERWGLVTAAPRDDALAHLVAAALPVPGLVASLESGAPSAVYAATAEGLGADPFFCLALVDGPDHVEAALVAGMKVIAVATHHEPGDLGNADMVVPSLRSLHVVGTHPVLVLEVDALPGVGTFNPGRFGRR